MNETRERIDYIDVAKGILIILVVIGHITNFEYVPTMLLKTWICSFHMPAFFIISGILCDPEKLRTRTFREFLGRKVYTLLVPYVFFEVTAGILQMIVFGTKSVNPVGIAFGMLTLHCNQGADWFLPTLFFAELLLFVVFKIENRGLYMASVLACAAFAFFMPELAYVIAVARRVAIAYVFIAIGQSFKRCFLYVNKAALFFCVWGTLAVCFFNRIVDMSMRQFNNPIWYLVGGIVGTYFIIGIARMLHSGFLKKAGKESLTIMGTHQNVQIITNILIGNSVYSIGTQIVVLFLTFIYEIVTVYVYAKYLSFFIGKNRHTSI